MPFLQNEVNLKVFFLTEALVLFVCEGNKGDRVFYNLTLKIKQRQMSSETATKDSLINTVYFNQELHVLSSCRLATDMHLGPLQHNFNTTKLTERKDKIQSHHLLIAAVSLRIQREDINALSEQNCTQQTRTLFYMVSEYFRDLPSPVLGLVKPLLVLKHFDDLP